MPNLQLTPQEQSELFKVLWEKSLVGVALVRDDGSFEYANPAYCQVVEYSEPELQKKSYTEITHPEDLEANSFLSQQVHDLSMPCYVMKKRYLTKTNRIVWVVLSVHPLLVDGQFRYFVSQISEVLAIVPIPVQKTPQIDFMKMIRDNYPWIIIVLGSAAYVASEVIKALNVE